MAACPLVSPGLLHVVGFWLVHVATASPQPVVTVKQTVWLLYLAISPLASAIEVMLCTSMISTDSGSDYVHRC